MNKEITIIICTYNREFYLKKALDSLVLQSIGNFNVLVVDNNSSDNTKEVVDLFNNKLNIQYFFEKKQGLSLARNKGIILAKTEYVSFLDDDALADKDWIKNAIMIINEKKPEIFGGPIFPFYISSKPMWFKDQYETLISRQGSGYLNKDQYLFGSNIFIKKEMFLLLGEFDVNLGVNGNNLSVGEETKIISIAHKKEIPVYYSENLVVKHVVMPNKLSFFYQINRYLISAKISATFLPSKGIFFNTSLFLKDIFIILLSLFLYPFRNRIRHPYWQNYFIERFLHRLRYYYFIKNDLKNIKNKC